MDPCNSSVGTIAYMSPERINTDLNHGKYNGFLLHIPLLINVFFFRLNSHQLFPPKFLSSTLLSENLVGPSKDNKTLEDDGVQLEPFNLEQERKEGFFDKTGNYVEYVTNDIKDAWLDSIDADPNLAKIHSMVTNDDVVEAADLSSHDIGNIKRRIADVLQPGETVLQALRRLKGSSNRKEKMSAETKLVFDQLTEDAMKLMEDGDYNVYDEKQEVFQREAEGFEKLARARGEGTSSSSGNKQPDSGVITDSGLNAIHPAADNNTSNNEGDFDMFADDDEKATVNPSAGTGSTENDYVFDESSGYYYSSSLGYYYDPSSGLYCSAASGQWYSYNQETGAYDELPSGEANTSTAWCNE